MTRIPTLAALALGVCLPALLYATAQDSTAAKGPTQSAPHAKTRKAGAAPAQGATEGNGDVIWEQQCSRCHTAPEGFSPRISGTVLRHMRVRASLSKHEEQELFNFLNP